jgi:hypothetical protein
VIVVRGSALVGERTAEVVVLVKIFWIAALMSEKSPFFGTREYDAEA